MVVGKVWFFSAAYVTETGAHIFTTALYNFQKVCSFFGIDPIIQIKIIFVAGKAKKYVKYGKIC
jgi:hypothetical protein